MANSKMARGPVSQSDFSKLNDPRLSANGDSASRKIALHGEAHNANRSIDVLPAALFNGCLSRIQKSTSVTIKDQAGQPPCSKRTGINIDSV